MRMRANLAVPVSEREFLNPLAGTHLPGVEVSTGIHCNRIDNVELACHGSVTADRSRHRSGFAVMDPNFIIVAVCDQNVLLAWIVREREIIRVSAISERSSTLPPASRRRRIHEETSHELTLFGKHLNAIAAALTYVN